MNLEDDILIDNYLRGLLDKNALVDFENRLKNDDAFKANFELEKRLWLSQNPDGWSFINESSKTHKAYKQLLESEELDDLKNTLRKADKEFKVKHTVKPTRKKSKYFYFLGAASIAIFVMFQLFFDTNISNEKLYKNYIDYNNLPSFVSRSNASSNALVKAQLLFEDGKYDAALTLFSKNVSSENIGATYIYKGLSEIELGQFNEAESTFNTLINSALLDAEKGYWYKALLFIKIDKIKDAKTILNDIVLNSRYKNKEAKTLLEELER